MRAWNSNGPQALAASNLYINLLITYSSLEISGNPARCGRLDFALRIRGKNDRRPKSQAPNNGPTDRGAAPPIAPASALPSIRAPLPVIKTAWVAASAGPGQGHKRVQSPNSHHLRPNSGCIQSAQSVDLSAIAPFKTHVPHGSS